jgi:alpha-tubulin suppressor-like RCC1 family protein
VSVEGVSGVGTLSGVTSVSSGGALGYCAVLTSSAVDCWGFGWNGELGNGRFYTSGNEGSVVPVTVAGVNGVGTLSGVASITSGGGRNCALLTSGGVDCWGYGYDGELGNGQFYTSGNEGSAVPVAVEGVNGVGTLSGVASLSLNSVYPGGGYCAVVASGAVDCWGYGVYGELGNGKPYTSGNKGSAVPVSVEGLSGVGTLSGVASLTWDGSNYCALLTSGAVDCWGWGAGGTLGNWQFSSTISSIPVSVEVPW